MKYHPVTELKLYQIKNDCKYPETNDCDGCEHTSEELGCSFKGPNILIDEVLERMDPIEVLEKLMNKDLKNNEEFERNSYDMAMRQGDRRYYLKIIKELQENLQSVVERGKRERWLK